MNVVLAVVAVLVLNRASLVAAGLAAAYSLAYLVGVQVSFRRLRRPLPDLRGEILVRHCVRLLSRRPRGGRRLAGLLGGHRALDLPAALGLALVLAGLVAVGLFVVLARLLRVTEVTQIVGPLLRRGNRAEASRPAEESLTIPAIRTPRQRPGVAASSQPNHS